ncbi:MAG TPA: nuclear transport factor 2 family protein [Novosphingobium sp.]|nr:nuclear transport factor 2 family protein [Novosphingobium sp.]
MRRWLLGGLCAGLMAGPASAAPATIDAQIDALAARVDRLEAARAVKTLQRAFGYYVDRGLWSEAADLFSDEGTVEIGLDGVYVGRARIRDYLKALGGGQPGLAYGRLNEWLQLQPVVDVAADGATAQARWRDLGMLGQYHQWAAWREGTYENSYVREGGLWKIRALHLYVNFQAPYEAGWARLKPGDGLRPSAASQAMPPDRPPTVTYSPFPAMQVPPFHAANPATGRPVRLPAGRP